MTTKAEDPVRGAAGARHTDAICERIDDSHFRVDGRELHLPIEIADCSFVLNAFLVDAAAAQRLLDGTGLTAARVLPGRAVLLLLAVDYRDNPLGDYNEAAVLLSAYPPGQSGAMRSWLGGALSMMLLRVPYYVHRMPVDQEFTAHAGRFLWGYPKYLATIDVQVTEADARARLAHDGELVFAIRAPRGESRRSLSTRTGYNLTWRRGQLRRIAGTVSGTGVAFRLGGVVPEIGERDALARELRELGLPKRPLLSVALPHARMRFGLPEAL